MPNVDRAAPSFDSLLRAAVDRARTVPLFEALGFGPGLAEVPRAAWPALGVDGLDGLAGLAHAGERGGVRALLVEVDDAPSTDLTARIARRVRARHPAGLFLFVFVGRGYRQFVFAALGAGDELRRLAVDRASPRRSDVEALAEMAARPGEGGVALALRHARALDRSRITRQFFRDFRAERARVAAAWIGPPPDATAERDRLALLFLCRLMFLYFLQSRGHLAGDSAYLRGLLRRWRRSPGATSYYRSVLEPLFFGALNTRPERRGPEARALGPLPYLNGGLFERTVLERRFPGLDLPGRVAVGVFVDFLERYRFTARESAEDAAGLDPGEATGIDPEMLGRVFEGLMAAERRSASGTFFTPAPVVDRLVRSALAAHLVGAFGLTPAVAAELVETGDATGLDPTRRRALERRLAGLRILDPACGSGAFLLGALTRLGRLRHALGGGPPDVVRRELVARSLYGVDVQDDAALLCALRLWLALAVEGGTERSDGRDEARPPGGAGREHAVCRAGPRPAALDPLPNLDRRIRQGDALVDPFDLIAADIRGSGSWSAALDPDVRRALRSIEPLAARYLSAGPEERAGIRRALAEAEARLADAWLDAFERRLDATARELRARAEERDLFGDRPPAARRAAAELRSLGPAIERLGQLRQDLEEHGAVPFFSFGIHFADAVERGFDIVVSNPPWVRVHRWPASLGRLVRARYEVCRRAGWRRGAQLAGAPAGVAAQIDLSLLFLERSLHLLAPGGTLAILLPAKAIRSLYGGGARRLILERTMVVAIEDHALDQRSIFRADAFTMSLVASNPGRSGDRAAGRAARESGWSRATAPGVRVTMIRRGVEPLRFVVDQADLPVVPGDFEAPWLLAPPAARSALRRMQRAGTALGCVPGISVRRGIMTGANDVLIFRRAEPKLGGLARVWAEGYDRARRDGRAAAHVRRFQGLVEADAVRPLVRGGDIGAWTFRSSGYVCWVHDDASAERVPPPPRIARYLARHADALAARSGARGRASGELFRLSPATLGPKVAWHDLAANLNAVALPARVRGLDGRDVPLIPLNTVYFIPTANERDALVLAGIFNSLPVRTFARATAERAKDARFRFLAWTVALIPLPPGWRTGPASDRIARLSANAHRDGRLDEDAAAELDEVVAALFGLREDEMDALRAFDRWLRGEP